jgi:hypothetical protein
MFRASLKNSVCRIFLCTLMLCASASVALACQPCLAEKSLTLEQSLAQADLIVVGYRSKLQPPQENDKTPQQTAVQVTRVLRGSVKENQISVHSYSGMCPYGVVLPDDKPYVLILRASGDATTYNAVDRCSVKALRVAADADQTVTLDEYEKKTLPLDKLTHDYITPPAYKPVVEFLQYLKNSGERDGGFGFDSTRGGSWKADEVLSFISRDGVTLYDINDKSTRRLTRVQLQRALSQRGNKTFTRFVHLGYIYAQPYPQDSTLIYEPRKNGVVVKVAGWYRLTFTRESGTLKLNKLEYLMVEGD